ncbi:trimethyllysine dioxygenase, mitochondrial [Tamandua tetradactyla]|uniref:trimethyllysine dioxygenase, mitochondrial n=1 Tax=Tamandua tetradactyla TaxID=48850 RepID=UPI00405499E7
MEYCTWTLDSRCSIKLWSFLSSFFLLPAPLTPNLFNECDRLALPGPDRSGFEALRSPGTELSLSQARRPPCAAGRSRAEHRGSQLGLSRRGEGSAEPTVSVAGAGGAGEGGVCELKAGHKAASGGSPCLQFLPFCRVGIHDLQHRTGEERPGLINLSGGKTLFLFGAKLNRDPSFVHHQDPLSTPPNIPHTFEPCTGTFHCPDLQDETLSRTQPARSGRNEGTCAARLQDLLKGRITYWVLQQHNFKNLFPVAIHWYHTTSKSLSCSWQQHEDHFGLH